MEPILVYEDYSETIRQMPQNYLIAKKQQNCFVMDPDLACDKDLATRVFLELFNFDSKYGSGLNLLSKVTPNKEFVYEVQGNYGGAAGWETVTEEDNVKDAEQSLVDYKNNNSQYPFRIKVKD